MISGSDNYIYDVIINDEMQFSVWPAQQSMPDGWHKAGFSGLIAACIKHIEGLWYDMRPVSFDRRMSVLEMPLSAATCCKVMTPFLPQPPLLSFVAEAEPSLAPAPVLLHRFFETQARERPEAIAIARGDNLMTYGELNARANRLAGLLRARGVGPDVLVGIAVERSFDMAVGLLGILKAGGAYVPLDPAYPAERLTYMIKDAALGLVLTQRRLAPHLPQGAVGFWCLDSDWPEAEAYPETDLCIPFDPENLAYCIYTSGSTGRPKGVMIAHSAVVSTLQGLINYTGLNSTDRLLMLASFSFDVSVSEFWTALMVGGRCVMAHPDAARDPAILFEDLASQQVTLLHAVPSLLAAFVPYLHRAKLPSLRHVLSGGEALTRDLKDVFLKNCTAQLHNCYGPTETAIHAAFGRCDANLNETNIPIGRAIASARIEILDPLMKPVGQGEIGEIFIGGLGLARGYHNRPGLTAERFLPDPWGNGTRLYKTGDRARFTGDGTIEFLGRIDTQVKIRGFRIELGEIEAGCLACQDVLQAVAVTGPDPAYPQLIAYIVAKPEVDIRSLPERLKLSLKTNLPAHMIPTRIIVLDALPLTPNGKVDRNGLSARPLPEFTSSNQARVQHTPQESLITRLMAEILKVETLGPDDNFFDYGGNSLLALRFATALEKALGRVISPAAVFEAPTAALLDIFINNMADQRGSDHLVPLIYKPHGTPLFLMHGEDGRLGDYIHLARYLKRDRPIYGLRLGSFEAELVSGTHLTLEMLSSRYVEEIRKVQPRGPYWICGYSFGGLVAFEVAQQLTSMGADVRLILIDAFRITPLRIALFWLGVLGIRLKKRTLLASLRGRFNRNWAAPAGPDPGYDARRKCLEHIVKRYNYRLYLGSTTLIQCVESDGELAHMNRDGLNGWGNVLKGALRIVPIHGFHYDFLKEPTVKEVANQINVDLYSGEQPSASLAVAI